MCSNPALGVPKLWTDKALELSGPPFPAPGTGDIRMPLGRTVVSSSRSRRAWPGTPPSRVWWWVALPRSAPGTWPSVQLCAPWTCLLGGHTHSFLLGAQEGGLGYRTDICSASVETISHFPQGLWQLAVW